MILVTRIYRTVLAAVVATSALLACNGADPGDLPDADADPDARLDAGQEASVKDVVVPDVRDAMVTVTDARPDTAWCGENPFPGVDLIAEGTGTNALHLLDLDTSEATELCPASQGPEGASISDRYVTWVAWPPNSQFTDKDVFIHDLQTHQTQHLVSTSGSSTYNTSVSGSKVVWEDFRNGQWDIYLYDTEADQETRLTDDPFDQTAPLIHYNLVTFVDYRFTGGYSGGYCARDVYILDIDTMIGRRVTTLPWAWWGRPGANGWLLAVLRDEPSLHAPAKLYLFDLIAMGILDPTGQHVLPEP